MPRTSPADRDRGLRLVGTVTGAVAAVSLVAVGAATALAAGDTEQHDDVRAAAIAPVTPVPQATTAGPGATAKKKAHPSSPAHPPTHTATARPKPKSTASHHTTPRTPARSEPTATYSTPPPVPSTGS